MAHLKNEHNEGNEEEKRQHQAAMAKEEQNIRTTRGSRHGGQWKQHNGGGGSSGWRIIIAYNGQQNRCGNLNHRRVLTIFSEQAGGDSMILLYLNPGYTPRCSLNKVR